MGLVISVVSDVSESKCENCGFPLIHVLVLLLYNCVGILTFNFYLIFLYCRFYKYLKRNFNRGELE